MVKKFLFILLILTSIIVNLYSENVSQNNIINKSTCVFIKDFNDKSLNEIKEILVNKAKLLCINEFFGESLFSEKIIQKGALKSFLVKSENFGIIHLKGNPDFYNGKNLGEICVNISAFVTDEDIKKLTPEKTYIKNFCVSNDTISISELKKKTREKAYIELIKKFFPGKNFTLKDALFLIHDFKILNENVDISSGTYCLSCSGKVIPFEINYYLNYAKNGNLDKKTLNQFKWKTTQIEGIYKYSWFCKKYCDKFICKKFSCDEHICNDCIYYAKQGKTSYSFLLDKPLENGGDVKLGIYFYPNKQNFLLTGLNSYELGNLVDFKKKYKACKMIVGHYYLLKGQDLSYLIQIKDFKCREVNKFLIFSTMKCDVSFRYIKISPMFKSLIGLISNLQ